MHLEFSWSTCTAFLYVASSELLSYWFALWSSSLYSHLLWHCVLHHCWLVMEGVQPWLYYYKLHCGRLTEMPALLYWLFLSLSAYFTTFSILHYLLHTSMHPTYFIAFGIFHWFLFILVHPLCTSLILSVCTSLPLMFIAPVYSSLLTGFGQNGYHFSLHACECRHLIFLYEYFAFDQALPTLPSLQLMLATYFLHAYMFPFQLGFCQQCYHFSLCWYS